MNMALWVLQSLLASLFLTAGGSKLLKPERMRLQGLPDVGLVLFIGVSEVLGSLGLILPALTKILAWLTPTAAIGLAVIMVLATRFHLRRKEAKAAGFTSFLLVLAAFVAVGRFVLSPLA